MTYSPEQIAKLQSTICDRIVGGESLRTICTDEDMPAASTVFLWLRDDKDFSEQYARAREAQADALFDEILDIADDGSNDWMERKNADGENIGWMENGEAMRRSILRVDARKWMAGKLRPKKYGDKIEVDNKHDLSDPMVSLLTRIANTGNRLVSSIKPSSSDEASPSDRNDIASEGDN